MLNVFHILELPSHGNGFTSSTSSLLKESSPEDGLASPIRKLARLDTDVDIASASASRAKVTRNPGSSVGGGRNNVVKMQIAGDFINKPKTTPVKDDRRIIKRFLKMILTRGVDFNRLPDTCGGIYNRCRAVVCKQGRGGDLYNDIKLELEQCMIRLDRELMESNAHVQGAEWTQLLVEVCDWYHDQESILRWALSFVDQVYVPTVKGLNNLHDLVYTMFNAKIFEDQAVEQLIRLSVTKWARDERGERKPHPLRDNITKLFNYFNLHGQYQRYENMYLAVTRAYYKAESTRKAEELKDHPDQFLKDVHALIDIEVERTKEIFLPMSWSGIKEATERSLMEGRAEWLASTATSQYLNTKDTDALFKMHELYVRIECKKQMCIAFGEYFREEVKRIVQDTETTMVESLLTAKALADDLINTVFLVASEAQPPPESPSASNSIVKKPDQDFVHALNDAFTLGFRARRMKPAEALAKHLDKILRKGQGTMTDAEFWDSLTKVLELYRYTDDKDVFRRFYHRQLAKRLLMQRSASDAFEKKMLKTLRDHYDSEFDDAQNMFTDMDLAREMMADYHSKLRDDSLGQKLFVMVLQTSAWPFPTPDQVVILPPEMQAELLAYDRKYYQKRHPKRKLTWDHSLGTMDVRARFKAAPKELSVSMFQGLVLLLFNESTELGYAEIKEATGILDDELQRTLQSLACGKKRVLKKVPMSAEVKDEDVFLFNNDFVDARSKIHINSIQAKVSVKESQKTQEAVEGDRKHVIDAAVVRIMKAKKEMAFELLVAETIDAVKKHFAPQVPMIKKRIDSLVEEEYLERSDTDRNVFRYLA
ncbi:Cullin-4B [Marasmius fiardii PR-910]|nr:Cullin-4B [Marasmius fiardii PR-910]